MTRLALDLSEWEKLGPTELPLLRGLSLESSGDAQRLAERLTSTRRVEILELSRGLQFRTTSFVGRFQLGALTVTIRPKLEGAPFLNLLRYAYNLRHLDPHTTVDFANAPYAFQDLLVHQLAEEATRILARGVHREYERKHEDLSVPRGRISFDRTLNPRYRTVPVLPCVHHPRTDDTTLNQLILAGLFWSLGLVADHVLKAQVRRLAALWSKGVSFKILDASLLRQARLAMDRRTGAYGPALTLIALLFESKGLSLDDDDVETPLPGFLFDMNRFFQALMLRFLQEHLTGYQVEDEHTLRGMFSYAPGCNPQKRTPPVQRPDYVVMTGAKVAALADAKYRDLWHNPLPSYMLYQLALYAVSQRGTNRRAVILYPTLARNAREQVMLIRPPRGAASPAQLTLQPVNLLELDVLLRRKSSKAVRERQALAAKLVLPEHRVFA